MVQECLAGSEHAWREFHKRFVRLATAVVKEQQARWRVSYPDVEDVVQATFVELLSAMEKYTGDYSLYRFVAGVTKRTARQEFRASKAAKRHGEHDPVDHHDSRAEGFITISTDCGLQDELLEAEERKSILRGALARLKEYCAELIMLRYFEGLSYKKIAETFSEKENTVTVKARRCLDQLRAHSHELVRRRCAR